jgi:hypothetical protein
MKNIVNLLTFLHCTLQWTLRHNLFTFWPNKILSKYNWPRRTLHSNWLRVAALCAKQPLELSTWESHLVHPLPLLVKMGQGNEFNSCPCVRFIAGLGLGFKNKGEATATLKMIFSVTKSNNCLVPYLIVNRGIVSPTLNITQHNYHSSLASSLGTFLPNNQLKCESKLGDP